jgi:hypothetical protein
VREVKFGRSERLDVLTPITSTLLVLVKENTSLAIKHKVWMLCGCRRDLTFVGFLRGVAEAETKLVKCNTSSYI